MSIQQDSCSIRLTKSRLAKGFLAIPKKHAHLFPLSKSDVNVTFDDEEAVETMSFLPDDKKAKETRIFGLASWFAERQMKPGDRVTITVVNHRKQLYNLGLDRYLRAQREKKTLDALRHAPNDESALKQLQLLSEITKRGRRRAAKELLLEIAQDTTYRQRSRTGGVKEGQHAVAAPAIRVLLGELHRGKCQVCSFTFTKKNGSQYFEVHHLDADVGDHPANLLVLCPNCHAQFDLAHTEAFERVGGWLVAVTINGRRLTVRQPLGTEPLKHIPAILRLLLISAQAGFSIFRL